MKLVGSAYVEIGVRLDKFDRQLGTARKRFAGSMANMRQVGRKMSMFVTAPIVGAGVAIAKTAGDFQTAMKTVAAVTERPGQSAETTTAQFEALRQKAMEMGATTKFSAAQAADAMKFMGMAGMDAATILDSMESTLNLAAAAQLDMGQAADIVTNVMKGMGIEAHELSGAVDTMVATFTTANTDLVQLGQAFKYAGPVAKVTGQSFEDMAAMIGLLGNAGIQASMAGTSLRGAITKLLNPTDDAIAVFERLGVAFKEPNGDLRRMVDIIGDLNKAGASAEDIFTIFSQRAGTGLAELISVGSEAIEAQIDLIDQDGKAAKIAGVYMEGWSGAIAKLKAAFEALAISMGDAGVLDFAIALAEGIRKVVQWFDSLSPTMKQIIAITLGVAAVFGPLVVIFGLVAGAVAAISSPVLIAIGVLAGLAAAATFLYANWDKIPDFFRRLWLEIKDAFYKGAEGILGIWETTMGWVPGLGHAIKAARKHIGGIRDTLAEQRRELDGSEKKWKSWRETFDSSTKVGAAVDKMKGMIAGAGGPVMMPGMDMDLLGGGGTGGSGGGGGDGPKWVSQYEAGLRRATGKQTKFFQQAKNELPQLGDLVVPSMDRLSLSIDSVGEGLAEAEAEGAALRERLIEGASEMSVMLSELKDAIADSLTFGIQSFANTIGFAFGQMAIGAQSMRETLDELKQSIKGIIRDLIRAIVKVMVIKGIMMALGAVGGGGIAKLLGEATGIKVPGAASGGVVTKPTIVAVGEGGESEAIVPLSRLAGMMKSMAPQFSMAEHRRSAPIVVNVAQPALQPSIGIQFGEIYVGLRRYMRDNGLTLPTA